MLCYNTLSTTKIFFRSDFVKYRRGTPVDNVDRKCQNWFRCNKCISMDTYGQCDPTQQTYGIYYDPMIKKFRCQETADDCQQKTCECDTEFANSIMFR